MASTNDHLDTVGELSAALERLGVTPILIGGMALVVLGSRRVTRGFDFVVAAVDEKTADVVRLLYDRGLELVSRLDKHGDVAATIANRRVAGTRLKTDRPPTAYFFDPRTRLRVDLLFDFPLPAASLLRGSTRVRIGAQTLRVASDQDLLRLKRIAAESRHVPGDAEDIAFLEARLAGGQS